MVAARTKFNSRNLMELAIEVIIRDTRAERALLFRPLNTYLTMLTKCNYSG
jgi:hypothetical protein